MVEASSSVGTIFSIEAMTICMRGKRRGQVAVALIGDDHRRAGLGDQEIGAGDADIGGKEFLAQHRARLGHEISARSSFRSRGRRSCVRRKSGSIVSLLRWMMGAMIWLGALAPELDDIFAEIGLDHLDAGGLQMRVEPDLLRHHRLALGDELGACLLGRA